MFSIGHRSWRGKHSGREITYRGVDDLGGVRHGTTADRPVVPYTGTLVIVLQVTIV